MTMPTTCPCGVRPDPGVCPDTCRAVDYAHCRCAHVEAAS